MLSEILEKATGDRLNTYTAQEWLTQWIEGKSGAVAKTSFVKYQQVVRDFLSYLGRKVDVTIEAVTPKEIIGFRNHLLKEGRTPQTVNGAVNKTLNVPFVAALRMGVIKINPIGNVPKLRKL